MLLKNLESRAVPFRYGAYLAGAVMSMALLGSERSAIFVLSTTLGLLSWPFCVHGFETFCLRHAAFNHPLRPLLVHGFEAFVTGALLGFANFPLLPLVAGAFALLVGHLAQAGWRLLLASLASACLGWRCGVSFAPLGWPASTTSADTLALVLIFGFGLALGDYSLRQAVRLHQAKLALAARSAALERLSYRLARYVPQPLNARLHASPDLPIQRERRFLTIAFLDLVNFVAFTNERPAEELNVVLDDYHCALETLTDRHGGSVTQTFGDGALLCFGDRGETRAAAARACIGLCVEVPRVVANLERRWSRQGYVVRVAVRIGVASGFCNMGDWGGQRLDYTVIGQPVNLASRLQQSAEAGNVLVDAATCALLEDQVRFGPVESLDLKGFGVVACHRLVDAEALSAMVPADSLGSSNTSDGQDFSPSLSR